ncbi:MAG: hypothetical protein EPO26_09985 [Chloroflexota bacterium]|nr:MAG: hypothetical protein EPO26_09985 [Chloroflexota bacterium]
MIAALRTRVAPAGRRLFATAGVFGILIFAFALRTRRLGLPTLTGDEWFMHRSAQEGAAWIVAHARVFEPHPLLYYLGIWAWEYAAGATEYALRFPSVAFGVLLVAGVWRLGYEVGGARIGFTAALLAALNPYLIAQSQNARNYQMVAALVTLTTASLLIATRTNRTGGHRWTRYTLFAIAALHTHLNALLAIGAHALWYAARAWGEEARTTRERLPLRRVPAIRAAIIIALAFVPWLIYAAPALQAYRGFYPERVTPWDVARRTVATFLLAETSAPSWQLAILVGLLAVGGIAATIGRRAHRTSSRLIVLAAVVPVATTAALFLVRPMFEERYLIVAAPMLSVLIAVGIGALSMGRRWLALGLLAAAIGATVPSTLGYYESIVTARTDWRGLVGWMAETGEASAAVLITGQGVADAYGYYRRSDFPATVTDDSATIDDTIEAIVASGATGVIHLPSWDSPVDARARDLLSERGFPGANRWFRNQRGQYFGLASGVDRRPVPIGAAWDSLTLVEGSVNPPVVAPGETIRVGLVWLNEGRGQMRDLKESVRIIDDRGDKRAQLDRFPRNDTARFPEVRSGTRLIDNHGIVAPSVPGGNYRVAVLLYEPENGRAVRPTRPTVSASDDTGDLVIVGEIIITPR